MLALEKYNLWIENLILEDEGVYACQVGDHISRTKLIVNIRVGQPTIRNKEEIEKLSDTLEVIEGRETLLECRSEGGKPAAKVNLTF